MTAFLGFGYLANMRLVILFCIQSLVTRPSSLASLHPRHLYPEGRALAHFGVLDVYLAAVV